MWNGLITFFGTNDLEKSHHFYADVLGLPLYKDQGTCRIYQVPGGGMLGFCQHITVNAQEKSPIITLLSEDVDGQYQRLVEAGFRPKHSPQVNPKFSIYHFFVVDPVGYTVEIQKFLD